MFNISNLALLNKLIVEFPLVGGLVNGNDLPLRVEIVTAVGQSSANFTDWYSDDPVRGFNTWDAVSIATPNGVTVLEDVTVRDHLMDSPDFTGEIAVLKDHYDTWQGGDPHRHIVIVKGFNSRTYREAELAKIDFNIIEQQPA